MPASCPAARSSVAARTDASNVVMTVIIAMPMLSATITSVVRPGLRAADRMASRAVRPCHATSGRPTHPNTGPTTAASRAARRAWRARLSSALGASLMRRFCALPSATTQM